MICKRCGLSYDVSMISKSYISKNPTKYEFCTDCRKYKKCEYCEFEFHHKQNRTCSVECANKLKELTYIKSCGAKHNFDRNSSSRIEWQQKLIDEEGITNVFQREEVKEISKLTINKKYGVNHISQNEQIKKQKNKKIKDKLVENPLFYKKIWHEIHNRLVDEIGYDPRLHVFGKASKSSLKVFNTLLDWCLEKGISYEDIYLGIEGKNEFFLKEKESIFMYDFTIRSKKIIIEFHGKAFHARKNDKNWFSVFTNESAEANIRKRNKKNNLAKSKGFKLLEIWEEDDLNLNIKKCQKFIDSHL